MHIMDGERVTKPKEIRRRHTDAFKQALVERSLVPGASVAAIAQDAGINANLLFNWRRLHLQAAASADAKEPRGPVLLPVTVVEEPPTSTTSGVPRPVAPARASVGSIEINIRGHTINRSAIRPHIRERAREESRAPEWDERCAVVGRPNRLERFESSRRVFRIAHLDRRPYNHRSESKTLFKPFGEHTSVNAHRFERERRENATGECCFAPGAAIGGVG